MSLFSLLGRAVVSDEIRATISVHAVNLGLSFTVRVRPNQITDRAVNRGGLAIGDTGGIPGGPTGLGWSKKAANVK